MHYLTSPHHISPRPTSHHALSAYKDCTQYCCCCGLWSSSPVLVLQRGRAHGTGQGTGRGRGRGQNTPEHTVRRLVYNPLGALEKAAQDCRQNTTALMQMGTHVVPVL